MKNNLHEKGIGGGTRMSVCLNVLGIDPRELQDSVISVLMGLYKKGYTWKDIGVALGYPTFNGGRVNQFTQLLSRSGLLTILKERGYQRHNPASWGATCLSKEVKASIKARRQIMVQTLRERFKTEETRVTRILRKTKKNLPIRDEIIPTLRDRGFSLEEIGQLFGVSRERIRQLEVKERTKLRRQNGSKTAKAAH